MPNCYTARRREGFFDELYEELLSKDEMSTLALGAMTYGQEFVPRHLPPEEKGRFGKTLYYPRDKPTTELGLIFFGEVCPASLGTMLSAKGSHYDEQSTKPITDWSIVKDVICLKNLTGGSSGLTQAFINQVVGLKEIMNKDARTREPGTCITEFLTSSDRNAKEIIKVTLPQKYKVPFYDYDHSDDLIPPINQTIRLGKFYPCHYLSDYGGDYFQHQNAKLVQLDIRDVDNKLIPPWKLYEKLRVGTVVLVEATLIRWDVPADKNKGKPAKIYQVQGHRLRILSESDEPVERRERPLLLNPPNSPRRQASTAFNSFQLGPRLPPPRFV